METTTRLNMPYVHIWAGDGAQLTEHPPSTHRGLSSVGNAELIIHGGVWLQSQHPEREFKITLCYILQEFKDNLNPAKALAAGLGSHQVTE